MRLWYFYSTPPDSSRSDTKHFGTNIQLIARKRKYFKYFFLVPHKAFFLLRKLNSCRYPVFILKSSFFLTCENVVRVNTNIALSCQYSLKPQRWKVLHFASVQKALVCLWTWSGTLEKKRLQNVFKRKIFTLKAPLIWFPCHTDKNLNTVKYLLWIHTTSHWISRSDHVW